MTLAVERERGMLGGRRAWWRSGRGQDIELAGEVGEGVHGGEADAKEGGLDKGAEQEREKGRAGRRGRERRTLEATVGSGCVRLWPRARVT